MKHLMENWRKFLVEEESDFETHMMYDPESGDKKEAKTEAEHNELAAKGYVHVDPAKVRKALEDEGGAAGTDAIVDRTDSSKEEVEKAMDNMPDVAQHKKGDYILGDKDKVKIDEDCWDGYERVPGSVEGEQGSCRKKTDEAQEELEEEIIDEAEICKAGKDWVDGKTIGGQLVKRGEDGKFNNWSARAAQIASKYCKDDNYGRGGKKKKNESAGGLTPEEFIKQHNLYPLNSKGQITVAPDQPLTMQAAKQVQEAGWKVEMQGQFVIITPTSVNEGDLGDWEKENWTHSDGTPCGGGDKDGSQSRCKPASKWKGMSKGEKAADNAKKKAGTDAGKQYVSATKKGKVTKAHTKESLDLTERGSPLESNFQNAIMDFIIEQMQTMGMNAGDPVDRSRIKRQVMSIVETAISAVGLEEAAKVKDKYGDEVEQRNKESMKQGLAFLKKETVESFVDMILDEAAELEEGGKCTGPTEKTTSTAKGKKYMKCIKNPDGKGYIRKHWGQKGARAAPKGSKRNKSFRARHGCSDAKAGTAKKLACDDW